MNAEKAKNGKNGRKLAPPTIGVAPVAPEVAAAEAGPPLAEATQPADGAAPATPDKPPADTVASALHAENTKLKAELEQLRKANEGLTQANGRLRFKLMSLADTVQSIVSQP